MESFTIGLKFPLEAKPHSTVLKGKSPTIPLLSFISASFVQRLSQRYPRFLHVTDFSKIVTADVQSTNPKAVERRLYDVLCILRAAGIVETTKKQKKSARESLIRLKPVLYAKVYGANFDFTVQKDAQLEWNSRHATPDQPLENASVMGSTTSFTDSEPTLASTSPPPVVFTAEDAAGIARKRRLDLLRHTRGGLGPAKRKQVEPGDSEGEGDSDEEGVGKKRRLSHRFSAEDGCFSSNTQGEASAHVQNDDRSTESPHRRSSLADEEYRVKVVALCAPPHSKFVRRCASAVQNPSCVVDIKELPEVGMHCCSPQCLLTCATDTQFMFCTTFT